MVFVTGGTGLVGSHLLAALSAQGKQVKALYRNTQPTALPGVEWVQGDIMDIQRLEELLEGVQDVYHCAAIVSFQKGESKQLLRYNVEGTANVVNACIGKGIRKLVFVSSVAALGRLREGQVINETMQWSEATSNSVYGKSKFLAEMEVWRGMGEGLQVAVVNPVIILGEGDWHKSSSAIFKTVYNEFPWYTEGTTGFVDVKDVVKAMMLLMESDISGRRFILSGKVDTYRNVFSAIAKGMGRKPPHKPVTPFLAKLVWRLEAVKAMFTGKMPLVTKETTRTAMAKVSFDNSRSLKEIPGFSYTDFDESIGRIARYYATSVSPT